jgi:hypothetical protein
MRKQYQWMALILFAVFFCCTSQDNNLKACGSNATACKATKEKVVNTVTHVKETEWEYGAEENNAFYLFAYPFIYSN